MFDIAESVINIEGVELFVVRGIHRNNPGDTLPLIFLHDSLGCAALWRDFPQDLCEHSSTDYILYDREGYGRSMDFRTIKRNTDYLENEADTLIKVMDELEIRKAILFGHSDGGSIALIAAAKYPERIDAIITEGAHVFVEEVTLEGIRNALKQYQTTNLREKLMKYHGNKTDHVFHAWTDTWLSPAYKSWNIEHFLKNIICPVLVLQGKNDEFGTEAQVNAIVENTPASTKLMMDDAAHSPHKEQPAATLKAVRKFIQNYFR